MRGGGTIVIKENAKSGWAWWAFDGNFEIDDDNNDDVAYVCVRSEEID